MDGIQRAVEALKELEIKRQLACGGYRAQILQKEADMVHLSELGFPNEEAPTIRMRTLMDEKRELEAKEAAAIAHVEHVERVLRSLTKDERTVLVERYVKPHRHGDAVMRRMAWDMHVSEETVRRVKRRALREFARRMGYT